MKSPQIALAAVAVFGTALSGCAAKESKPVASEASGTQVTVTATDTGCALSADSGGTGSTTFVVTNNGTKVTELYVYDKDNRAVAEVENISPGLQRQLAVELTEAGPYTVACKPGMVGDGIRADYTVKS